MNITYFLFKAGYSPVALSWISIIIYAILGFIIKPVMLVKIADYKWREILSVFKPCLAVTLAAIPLPLLFVMLYKMPGSIIGFCLTALIAVFSVAASFWFIGMDKETRKSMLAMVIKK